MSQIRLLFGPLVIQLVWYILKQYSPQCQWKWSHYSLSLGWIIIKSSSNKRRTEIAALSTLFQTQRLFENGAFFETGPHSNKCNICFLSYKYWDILFANHEGKDDLFANQIEEISPPQLNDYLRLSEFVLAARKKDSNKEYEPTSLRLMFASFERHLKKQNYACYSIFKALQSKQKDTGFKLFS